MGRQGKCNILSPQKPSTETDNTHLNCTVVTASANKLGAPPGWVTGIHKGSMPLQSFNPLACFTIPHRHSFICGCWEEHTRKQEEEKKKKWRQGIAIYLPYLSKCTQVFKITNMLCSDSLAPALEMSHPMYPNPNSSLDPIIRPTLINVKKIFPLSVPMTYCTSNTAVFSIFPSFVIYYTSHIFPLENV